MRAILAVAIASLLSLPSTGRAQASVDIHIGLPVVLPQLVVVSPGIQVVPGVSEEVFFVDGFYWARRDQLWYRSRAHTGGWVLVPGRGVPPGLARIPPGKYKNWKGGPPRAAPAAYRGGPAGPAFYGPGPGRGGHDGGGKRKGHGKH